MKKQKDADALPIKIWFTIIAIKLVAQIAWAVENTWFTSYVYAEIGPYVNITTAMVAISAVVSTIVTLLVGTLSDRIGRRKPFIVYGFIIWGFMTILYGFTANIFVRSVTMAGIACVIVDALMSAFGSMASDAGFSAWTTDVTTEKNRAMLGAWFAALPIVALIILNLTAGVIIDRFGYSVFMTIVGAVVIIFGLASIFLVKDSPGLKPQKEGSYLKQLGKAFNFKYLKENRALMMVFIAYGYYFIVFDAWMPYMNVLLIDYMGFSAATAGLVTALSTVIALVSLVPFTMLIKRKKEFVVMVIVAICFCVGAIVMGIAKSTPAALIVVIVGGVFMLISDFGIEQVCTTWMKNLYPEDARGQFEGIRMIFYVALPMVFGSLLGNVLIKHLGDSYNDGFIINDKVMIVLGLLSLLLIIPGYFAYKFVKKDAIKKGKEIN